MTGSVWSMSLKELAEPRPSGDYVKRAIERAANAAGLHYWRAFDIWYGKARRIDAHEAQAISDAIEKKREEEAQNELHDLRTRLLKMESRIAAEAANGRRNRNRPTGTPLPGFGVGDSPVAGGGR